MHDVNDCIRGESMIFICLYIHKNIFKSERECEVTQSCPTLCYSMDCSPPGFFIHGVFQARILGWVAISFPGDLPHSGIEPSFPTLQADALPSEPPERT